MRNNIKRVFFLLAFLFFCLILHFMKFAFLDRKEIVANAYNPRLSIMDESIVRGQIQDRNGAALAETNAETKERSYPFGRVLAHVVGFVDAGKTGMEAVYNFEMQTVQLEVWNRLVNVFQGGELYGNHVVSTLDAALSQKAYDLIADYRGAVVVMEPKTGKILAMVSTPSFQPEKIETNYQELIADVEDTRLMNRASQGLYPPGSVFKIVTGAAFIENNPRFDDFVYTCTGKLTRDGKTIQCAGGKAHGEVDFFKAMEVSCNGYFALAAEQVGADALTATAERFFFNKPFGFVLPYSVPKFSLHTGDVPALFETSIGQGKTLTSPLHMAMITSSVANGGVMMKPYVLDYVAYAKSGKVKERTIPEMITKTMDAKTAVFLKDAMILTVEKGTAQKAKMKGVRVAGKTGTAQNEKEGEHAWFVGFAPADDPQVCVAVILENAGSGSVAVPIGQKLMKAALEE